jgi:hypothetical protein
VDRREGAGVSRADLLALSPESVAALSNLGLVKRAQREIAEGAGPALEEHAGGVVTGRFKDGTVATLLPGKTLRETPCTCGAPTVCRHRVAVALAYASWHASRAPATTDADATVAPTEPLGPPSPIDASWSPACFTDEALTAALGKRTMERARLLVRAGVVVELDHDGIPAARLPTCAVRFHVPRDLAYARCDCAVATACEHVAIAAWAFRKAEAIDASRPPRTVELAREGAGASVSAGATTALDEATALAAAVLAEGVTGLEPDVAPRFARARERLAGAGLVWPAVLVDDLERSVEAYRAQSARYRASEAAALVAGLFARARACAEGAEGELPARYVLGADEARETLLDHVRLVSLGARVTADDRARDVEVFLADPDSGVVLVLAKRWTFGDGETPDDGPALARRSVASRVALGAIAGGQMISRAVKRRANRSLALGVTRGGSTSVTPQTGAWELLPTSILCASFEALRAALDGAPPRLLRPRVLADAMRVVRVARVGRIAYDPGEQQLMAELHDAEGQALLLVRRYRSAAPGALDAIGAALMADPGVRFVAGDVRHGPHGLEIDPVGLVTDRVIVPDLEAAPPASVALPRGGDGGGAPSPMLAALDGAASVLEEACHGGLARPRGEWVARTSAAARRLDDMGLAGAAVRLRVLAEKVRALGDRADGGLLRDAAEAWASAAIRVELTRELAVRA